MNTNPNPSPLRSKLLLPLLLAVPVTAVAVASACASGSTHLPNRDRGRYLVEQVGLCKDCHSPRNERGEFLVDRWLQGSMIPFKPTIPMPWAEVSIPIAGLPTLPDDAQAMTFLTTGVLPGGRLPRPPMPPYRFSPEDARDVIAYLRHPDAPTSPSGEIAPSR